MLAKYVNAARVIARRKCLSIARRIVTAALGTDHNKVRYEILRVDSIPGFLLHFRFLIRSAFSILYIAYYCSEMLPYV